MNQEKRDRELGMGRRITRRDFLNGVAVGIGALGSCRIVRAGFSLRLRGGSSSSGILSARSHGYERQSARRL